MTSSARAVPFYCPYCGDEDLQPFSDRHGGWWCQSCRRAWTLSMIGTGTPSTIADKLADTPETTPEPG